MSITHFLDAYYLRTPPRKRKRERESPESRPRGSVDYIREQIFLLSEHSSATRRAPDTHAVVGQRGLSGRIETGHFSHHLAERFSRAICLLIRSRHDALFRVNLKVISPFLSVRVIRRRVISSRVTFREFSLAENARSCGGGVAKNLIQTITRVRAIPVLLSARTHLFRSGNL